MKSEFKNTQKSFSNVYAQQYETEGRCQVVNGEWFLISDSGYRKLMEDKEQLLKSGAYTEHDQVIQEINRKLRELSCTGWKELLHFRWYFFAFQKNCPCFQLF